MEEKRIELLNEAAKYFSDEKLAKLKEIIEAYCKTEEDYYTIAAAIEYATTIDKNEDYYNRLLNSLSANIIAIDEKRLSFLLTLVNILSKNGNKLLDDLSNPGIEKQIQRVRDISALMSKGLSYFEASTLASTSLMDLDIGDAEKYTLVNINDNDTEGLATKERLILYREVQTENNNGTIRIIFFVTNDDYIRIIHNSETKQAHFTNRKGNYDEVKELEVKTREITEENAKCPDFNEGRIEYLTMYNEALKEVIPTITILNEVKEELDELSKNTKGSLKAEEILNKQYKKRILVNPETTVK